MEQQIMDEEWRPVAGYEGLYEASSFGRVRSLPRTFIKRDGVPCCVAGKILGTIRPSSKPRRYTTVSLRSGTDGRLPLQKMIHQIIAETFVPNPDGKEEVNHKNGNTRDNAASNLEWMTPLENMTHAIKTGLFEPSGKHAQRGEEHPRCRTTFEQILAIRKDRAGGMLYQALHEKYELCLPYLSLIVKGKVRQSA